MRLDSLATEMQMSGDLGVRHSFSDKLEDLTLALAQRSGEGLEPRRAEFHGDGQVSLDLQLRAGARDGVTG